MRIMHTPYLLNIGWSNIMNTITAMSVCIIISCIVSALGDVMIKHAVEQPDKRMLYMIVPMLLLGIISPWCFYFMINNYRGMVIVNIVYCIVGTVMIAVVDNIIFGQRITTTESVGIVLGLIALICMTYDKQL